MRHVLPAAAWRPVLLLVLAFGLAACSSATPTTGSPPAGGGAPPAATATPSSPAPSPTAVATTAAGVASPTAPACPVEQAVCDFAARLAQRLTEGNYDAVVLQSVDAAYTCPGPVAEGPGGPFPLCNGSRAGEQRMGYAHARLQSEGTIMSAEQYRDLLRTAVTAADVGRSDAFGPGGFRLVSIGCPQEQATPCAQRFVVAFSSIQPPPQPQSAAVRTVLLFFVEQQAGAAPRIRMVVDGALFPGDPHEAALRGGTAQTFSPREMGPFGVFHAWNPGPQR